MSVIATMTLIWAIAGLQLVQHVVAIPAVTARSYVSRQVRRHIDGGQRIVFLKGLEDLSEFVPKHSNWNDPDWRRADHVYLVDPGPLNRAAWAQRFGARSWQVVGYEADTKAVSVEEGRLGQSFVMPGQ